MRFVPANIFLYFFLLLLGTSGFFFAVAWPQAEGFYAFIVLAAAGGAGVSSYIRYTKSRHQQLVCPVGSNCNAVINSQYSKFLGVSLEYWGILYYSILVVSYLALILLRGAMPSMFLSGLTIATAGAFLFSLYLLFVQAFILRQWCIWCLLSALLSIAIFTASMAGMDFGLMFLSQATNLIETIRALGFAFGVGGGTAAVFLFSRFVRNLDLDPEEAQAMKGILELVLLGGVLALISQFALYITYAETLSQHAAFLVQIGALFLAAVSGAVLMIVFAPIMSAIPFREVRQGESSFSLVPLRKSLFVVGAIALASWYFAFAMDHYSLDYGYIVLLGTLAATVAVAIIVALAWERRIGTTSISEK